MTVSTLAIALLLASAQTSTDNLLPASDAPVAAPVPATASAGDTAATSAPAVGQADGAPSTAPPPIVLPALLPPPAVTTMAPATTDDDGAIVVTARRRSIPADPLSNINAASFEAIQMVDKVVVGPTARTYEKAVPKPVRNGLRNFLINLAEPIVFVNYLLQFKPGKAAETAGRFALNSTIGVVGLFDMAKRKPFHLPYRQNGFANTFGYHGIGNGPFLFVPILGPTTARDLVGRILDLGLMPAVIGKPFDNPAYGLGTGIVKSMNDRVEFDEQIAKIRDTADPYVATRDFYLKRRRAEINALHSAEYRARKGIADPVLPRVEPHAPAGETPVTSIPGSTGMVPAAPAPAEPVSGTPAIAP